FAERLANEGYVVTLGITPTYAETGYGYIQATEPLKEWEGYSSYLVTKFHEKPSKEKAEEFLKQGGFSWNAGIFVFKVAKMIEHFQKHQAALWQTVSELKADLSNIEEIYKKLPSISLDFAIMEHLGPEQLACIPSEMGWNDVGSWDAVAAEVGDKNSGLAEVVQFQAENNFVF